ncbi:MAG: Nramp family divalent metal transporter [Dehalococcoidales bacterium]|nr:Nramp family divalent metal transporter [Dehalococcoidales bacterium]
MADRTPRPEPPKGRAGNKAPRSAAGTPMQRERPADTTQEISAGEALAGKARGWWFARLWPFLGPAFVASVAYMDPGNYATNIQGGAKYGYTLLWVVFASNLMAMLIQSLSAKLGIATGRNLAELCRDRFPPPVVWLMWIVSEVVAMATDLAEFLGAAIGFYLLFGLPLLAAGLLTGVLTFLILGLQRYGYRPIEAVITALVGVIALAYLVETVLERPPWGQLLQAAVRPGFAGPESVVLAVGILGATVMPHVIFLHSALVQNRILAPTPEQARQLFRLEVVDVVLAMGLAGLINAAMLIMAATTFYATGRSGVATISQAYQTLTPLLGGLSSTLFAISLLAAGLSSSTVGTMAGQVVMQGFTHRSIPVWIRRIATMAPALVVIALSFDLTQTLVISQVVLSFGIPFALVPLIMFTSRRDVMGDLRNHHLTTVVAWLVAALIIGLNGYLLWQTATGGV